ncbi:MAG TPA: serine hydrolase domain-containing protein, partial [Gemmatimonadaceae bacterium]|nr:serine hydrolase domain-containing protein [Gemmatimonadaceae bacterium]
MHALPVVPRFAFLLAGLAAAPAAPAQPTTPPAAGYEGVATRLTTLVEREMRAKGIRALSLALVDGDRTVWAGGFGWARMADSVAATAETVYRVGSVSKLFTDVAVMQLVEQGTLALDAPISTLVPALAADAGARPITLRMLMAHRAGIQREPPVGHYFDTSGATLAATVASLHGARRPYPPGARTKYSNAGVAAVGRALEVAAGRPFTAMVTERVLTPVGMTRSGFALTPALRAGLAEGEMWTYDGRSFPAPVFELGMAPAGNLYSTANDLARFAAVLLARGRAPSGRLLSPAALDTMWTPQLATPGAGAGFGLGFIVGTLDGRRRLGHNGAVYGFATELAVLPDAGLAAVVIAAKDGANGTAARLADQALRLLLARRTGTFPPDDSTLAVPPDLATKLAGRWLGKTGAAELRARAGRLFLWRARGGVRLELRAHGDSLLVDDVVAGVGPGLRLVGDALIYAGDTLRRAPEPAPAPPPP